MLTKDPTWIINNDKRDYCKALSVHNFSHYDSTKREKSFETKANKTEVLRIGSRWNIVPLSNVFANFLHPWSTFEKTVVDEDLRLKYVCAKKSRRNV